MKVPLSLLKEYLSFEHSPAELEAVLTLAGIEVDGMVSVGSSFSGVVVAEILEVNPHPSADRLRVAVVSDGSEILQIVCGAANCRPGIKTALAKIGAQLTDSEGKSFKINKGKLRGVESFGMLCGADELQLGAGEGIMELSQELILGTSLSTLYSDVIFDLSLTPNLGHCLSILGIARELSAHLAIPLKKKALSFQEEGDSITKSVHVELIDKKQCPRYACRLVKGIQVGPSPDWLRKKLEACGSRSINNVVDVGNLVMLEMGQPLHLFDYDKIEGGRLIITSETPHQDMQTLDGQLRAIHPSVLLICDPVKPLAFAGVMGGDSSAVTNTTVNILIEAAHFVPQSIRKSTRLLQLKSDSSYRFEKGVDPHLVLQALDYAAALLSQVAGGVIGKGVIDIQAHQFHPKKVACRIHRVNAMLGTQLSISEVAQLLTRLQMEVVEENLNQLLIAVPSFRMDITTEIDLIEEVARIYGYNNIVKLPPRQISSSLMNAPLYEMEKLMRARLMQEGLQEFMTCDLISPSQSSMSLMHNMKEEHVVKVLLSHSVDQSVLRTTLLPGLMQVIKYNSDHGNGDIAGFEVGRIHFKEGDSYFEPSVAAIVLSGRRDPYHFDPKPRESDFFDLKGIVENVIGSVKAGALRFEVSHFPQFHPSRQARILIGDTLLGVLGEVHPKQVEQLGLSQRILFAQINLNELLLLCPKDWKVAPLVPFPGSERDWTVTVNDAVTIDSLLSAIQGASSPLLEKVLLLSLYKSAQIGEDRKNVTFRFFYRDKDKTLSFDEVEKEHARIVNVSSLNLS